MRIQARNEENIRLESVFLEDIVEGTEFLLNAELVVLPSY